jgi:hypothetical protein
MTKAAMRDSGITPPSVIVGSTDELAQQLLGIANTTGNEITERGDWEVLKSEATFAAIAPEQQFILRTQFTDFDHIIAETMWNRTRQTRVMGPLTPQTWQRLKATTVSPAALYCRIRGGALLLMGDYTAGDTLAFEYVSNKWASNSAGVAFFTEFQNDTDTVRFDDELMVLGIRWRFFRENGLEYGEAFRMYEERLHLRGSKDIPRETLSMNRTPRTDLGTGFIPEGNWNQ